MMVLLDTSALVGCLAGAHEHEGTLRGLVRQALPLRLCAPVLYEWYRGDRNSRELDAQRQVFPDELAVPFGSVEAALAARLYRSVRRPRGREMDLAIAACAIVNKATLWTLNKADFADIPGLKLY